MNTDTTIKKHDLIGSNYTTFKHCSDPNYEYLLKFYHTRKSKNETYSEKLQVYNITSVTYSTLNNRVEFTSDDKIVTPKAFNDCEFVIIPKNADEKSNMDMVTLFRPMFYDTSSDVTINIDRDSFLFKLSLNGAKFNKFTKNKIVAKVDYWLAEH